MICPKCGSANADGATFCIGCGTDLQSAQGQPPPAPGMPPPSSQASQWPPPPQSQQPQQPPFSQQAPPQYAPPPPGYGPAPQGYGYGYGYGQPQTTNALAIVSLCLGISGFMCGITWIAALITGYIAKGNIDSSGGREGGRGLAIAGIVLGWVGVALMVGFIVLVIVVSAFSEETALAG